MPFIEQGSDMRTLAASAIKYGQKNANFAIPLEWLKKIQKKSATYAKNLARVIAEHENTHRAKSAVHLTVREVGILTDLSRGLSRTEIAASRDLSINTVKAALQTIYIKLGAQDGPDALRIAASLGLL
jgi:LuxR family maltose regulon positive regulatory protein